MQCRAGRDGAGSGRGPRRRRGSGGSCLVDALIKDNICINAGKNEEAIDSLGRALEQSPRHPIGLLNMGRAQPLRGDAEMRIDAIRTPLSASPAARAAHACWRSHARRAARRSDRSTPWMPL